MGRAGPHSGWLLIVALSLGCAASLDLDRARGLLSLPRRTSAPTLGRATAELPAPAGLAAVSGELRSVPLSWEPILSDEIAGYAVERANASEGPFERIAVLVGGGNTVWVDQGTSGTIFSEAPPLSDGTTRYYRVRPFTQSGELAERASAVVSGTTAPPPAPPALLRAYSNRPREVPLSWRASDDPTVGGYQVERSPTSQGPFEPLATLDGRYATAFVDQGLGDLRVFYYRVAARNLAGGLGMPCAPVRAVTKPEPLPPFGLRIAGQELGINLVSWEPNVERDIETYRLYRRREGESAAVPIATLRGPQARDVAVAADERVWYRVLAVDRDGLESELAAAIEVTSVGYDLTASATPEGVRLAWNPRGEEGYSGARVLALGPLRARELAFVENGSSYLDRDLAWGERRRYTVVLERADGTRAPRATPIEVERPARPAGSSMGAGERLEGLSSE